MKKNKLKSILKSYSKGFCTYSDEFKYFNIHDDFYVKLKEPIVNLPSIFTKKEVFKVISVLEDKNKKSFDLIIRYLHYNAIVSYKEIKHFKTNCFFTVKNKRGLDEFICVKETKKHFYIKDKINDKLIKVIKKGYKKI